MDKDIYREEGVPDSPESHSRVSWKKNNSMLRNWDLKKAARSNQECDSGCVSLNSDGSMYRDWDFKGSAQSKPEYESGFASGSTFSKGDVSQPECEHGFVKIGGSKFINWDFTKGDVCQSKLETGRRCVSLKSRNSMLRDRDLEGSPQSNPEPGRRCVSLKCNSMFRDWDFITSSQSKVKQQGLEEVPLDSIFVNLEKKIISFVQDELKKFQRVLASDYPECLVNEEDEEQKNKEAFLQITLDFLRKMQLEELANCLQSRSNYGVCQRKLKSSLKQRYRCVFEGIAKAGNPNLLNQIYTELYITEGGAAGVNQEHEVRQIKTTSRKPAAPEATITSEDIFKGPTHRQGPIRTVLTKGQGPIGAEWTKKQEPIRAELTKGQGPIRVELTERPRPFRIVLTKGVAGIGKTVLTQKFSLDWAEGRANQDIQLLFPFTFRELNVLRDTQFSLVGLLHHFFSESAGLSLEDLRVVFIFDGLDECRLPLDFTQTKALTDTTESSSVDVLLVNLIRGTLLPSARLWITTRPTAANQIPAECVSMVTEVRGFADPQKEQYFRKRFRDEQQATAVISHIRTSRSLHIMSHIPVFCWILSTVLHHVMETEATDQLPQTLTQMYIHFLVVQAKVKSFKYDGHSEADFSWDPETRRMVEFLGKLAFEQLQKGNLIFYESDLRECGLDPTAASVYSGVFTQVFREEPGRYQDKVYCFVHLSVQEFLAALHVHLTFYNTGINLLLPEQTHDTQGSKELFYQSAINQAFQSPNGHWDLFLRFLLGLSLPTNQNLLQGMNSETGNAAEETAVYIKLKMNDYSSSERVLNLFHCLNELNDNSLVDMIQSNLKSGHFSKRMSPAQWSALAFILLSSEKDPYVFELKKYCASEEVLLRLLPVVKASSRAILAACNLGEEGCAALSSVLRSKSLCLKELDLSYNSLRESGVQLLAMGLQGPHCTLQTLRLQCCCLSMGSCGPLSTVIARSPSLRHLDLSNNDLMDSGVEQLSVGLGSPDCRLESLRLSGCMVSGKGCSALTAVLNQSHSFLKELDLSYNYPTLPGVKLLSSVDKNVYLKNLRLTPCGEQFLKPGHKKYFCDLTLDPNTAYRKLNLSDDNRTVIFVEEEQLYPDHVDRFDWYPQVLCSTGLTGRHYWEVEWSGVVSIAVSYREIPRKGDDTSNVFGQNSYSWRLWCSDGRLSVCENKEEEYLDMPPSDAFGRVAVFLDCPAGFLSFYRVLDGQLIHLHTFHTNFTEPLFAGFGFGSCFSSVTLITE